MKQLHIYNPTDFDDEWFEKKVAGCLVKKDAIGLIALFNNNDKLPFVCGNASLLKKHGLYEACFVYAWMMGKTQHFTSSALLLMLSFGCRENFVQSGDPLPPSDKNGRYLLYRGIARPGRISGLSWTNNFDQAKWFADRFERAGKAVYQASIKKNNIFFYSNERQENEFVIIPPKRYKKVWGAE